jgi:NADH-quinone oxidoreductase subunit H
MVGILRSSQFLRLIVPLLGRVRFTTLRERKGMGRMQRRSGPRTTGFLGILQPIADGVKLVLKQSLIPNTRNVRLYLGRPVVRFRTRLINWLVIPLDRGRVIYARDFGLLFLFRVSRLEVYGIMFAGWRSNSKYAFLGCLRSAAQMVSYEVCLGLLLLCAVFPVRSVNFVDVVEFQQEGSWLIWSQFPVAGRYGIAMLAETNRAPFDLPEREAELVAGYNVEYGSMGFALFFLGEYRAMGALARLRRILWFGGWLSPVDALPHGRVWMGLKTSILIRGYIWVRARFPRYRYDQLMRIGWQVLLPLSMVFFLWVRVTSLLVR